MCGIAGLIMNDSRIEKISITRKMSDAIMHRGRDGEGYWANKDNTVAFGHRRLSIIDLSDNGSQPMHYCDERYTIVYNGEIYNYLEIKSELERIGAKFKSNCDTEVILALYHLKGVECVHSFDGMFAFAIWDDQKKELFCARDRFGEKPFFYHHVPGEAFYFASEMKALWAIGIPKELDERRMGMYLKLQFIDASNPSSTFYKNIYQLDAAHYIKITDLNSILQKRYYSLDDISKLENINEKDAASVLFSMLKKSVELRLRSDVPVGSSLSGGLDSSSIVMLIDQLKGNEVAQNSFSARFSDFSKDEGYYINKIVSTCKQIRNHEIWPDKDQLKSELTNVVYHQEEPFASSSIFAQWKVMELAKLNGVTVLLDGQGADEYMAGYLPYYQLYANQLFYNNRQLFHEEVEAYNNLRKPETIGNQITLRQRAGYIRRKFFGKDLPFPENALSNQLKRDTMVDGLKVLLRYADRNAMAHSREVRLPFLDHKIVEFVFSLPDDFLLHKGWTKWILRKAMEDSLPSEVTWRVDKVGYEPPESEWLKGLVNENTKKQVQQYLFDNKLSAVNSKSAITDWNYFMINKILE